MSVNDRRTSQPPSAGSARSGRALPPDTRRASPPTDAAPWEEPLPTVTGRAWAFGTVLTLADVLPPRFAALPPAEARRRVLADIDPHWAAQVAAGDVICVEELHGGDEAGAPMLPQTAVAALAALAQTGVAALIAQRYAPHVEDAALAAGIVPVTLDAPAFMHTGDRVRLDLEAAKIVNLSSGDRAGIRNLDEARRAAVRAMLRARGGA